MQIGFMGLGQMGREMARRLIGAGHELVVYNRTRAAAESMREQGAQIADSPAGALDAEVVVTMLAHDAAVHEVWIAPDLAKKMRPGTIHLNMASVSMKIARALAALHEKAGSHYVAAPVFGRPYAAAKGQLDIVAAGPAPAIARCEPLFSVLGRQSFVAGAEPYMANIVKIARNYLLATVVESLGETLALTRKSGVDPGLFLNIITSTSFSAPVYKTYGRMIVEKDFEPTFALKLGLKDVELALEAAADTQVPLPMADVIREQHLAAIASGFGEKDWTALGEYIAQRAGL